MKDMKNLFKGFVLTMIVFVAFGFDLSAQDYKGAVESLTIIKTEQATVLQQLETTDPNSGAYVDLKYQVAAYLAMEKVLGHEDASDEIVEEAIVVGIITATNNAVTQEEFFDTGITDPRGVALKNHLTALLSN